MPVSYDDFNTYDWIRKTIEEWMSASSGIGINGYAEACMTQLVYNGGDIHAVKYLVSIGVGVNYLSYRMHMPITYGYYAIMQFFIAIGPFPII